MQANRNILNRDNHLLKANDVAAVLNVSRSFAYLIMKNGELPTVRLGRSVRVRSEDLEKYIQRNLSVDDNKS